MKLNRFARRFYNLEITTSPAITAWDASFDGGTTWVAGESATVGGTPVFRWLLAGPNATPGTATVITTDVIPIIRATDTPEIVAEEDDIPAVRLT